MRTPTFAFLLLLGLSGSVLAANGDPEPSVSPNQSPVDDAQHRDMAKPGESQGHPAEGEPVQQPNEQHNNQAHGPTSGGQPDGGVTPEQPYRSPGTREE